MGRRKPRKAFLPANPKTPNSRLIRSEDTEDHEISAMSVKPLMKRILLLQNTCLTIRYVKETISRSMIFIELRIWTTLITTRLAKPSCKTNMTSSMIPMKPLITETQVTVVTSMPRNATRKKTRKKRKRRIILWMEICRFMCLSPVITRVTYHSETTPLLVPLEPRPSVLFSPRDRRRSWRHWENHWSLNWKVPSAAVLIASRTDLTNRNGIKSDFKKNQSNPIFLTLWLIFFILMIFFISFWENNIV